MFRHLGFEKLDLEDMTQTKYRFDIIYQTKKLKEVSDFMAKCDLDPGEYGMKEKIEVICKERKDSQVIKDTVKQSYEMAGLRVLMIEGGIYE